MKGASSVLSPREVKLHASMSGEGHPLLLVHGLAGSGRWWRKNVPVLARSFRVFTVDLAGFGRSRGQRFKLQDAAGLLLRWMDAAKIDRCHVIGHSMGGYVTTALLARAPERIDRIILVDPALAPLPASLASNSLRLAKSVRYMAVDFLPVLLADTLLAGPVTLYRAVQELIHSNLSAHLSALRGDLLMVWGEKDALLPLSIGRELQRQLPSAQFVVIHGAGHNPMWDRPREFNRLAVEFLKGAKRVEATERLPGEALRPG